MIINDTALNYIRYTTRVRLIKMKKTLSKIVLSEPRWTLTEEEFGIFRNELSKNRRNAIFFSPLNACARVVKIE